MLSAMSPSSTVRSSLEEMLDSLRRRDESEKRRDESEKPRDLPPALPVRPMSRARRPSTRRSLPDNFKVVDAAPKRAPQELKFRESASLPDLKPREAASPHDSKSRGDAKRKTRKEKELSCRAGSFGSKKMKGVQPGELPYVMEEGDASDPAAASCSPSVRFRESEWNDNICYFIKKKLSVWCLLPTGKWELGKIQSTCDEDAFVLLSSGNVVQLSTGDLLPANPDILEGVDDLTQLSYLNEPSVLHNLEYRYSKDIIYSKAGPVLIAINPFKNIHIIGNDFITAYKQKLRDNPHIYAIADSSYNAMMRGAANQSIIISGESGSGKTEAAKIALQYLATLGGGRGGLECEILKTSCILEAFGNAKTSRNDNSSRFGKLIEIHFSGLGKICGAKIQTFLLEKSRVVQLANGERSYHIFYQLCAGGPSYLKDKLNLKKATEYNYLNQSDCLEIDDVDNAHKFQMLVEALDVVRICKEDQERAFELLAAVLWLGNVQFQVTDSENHVEVIADDAVTTAAKLMGCREQDLMLTLSTHQIKAGKDSIAKTLTLWQAIDRRNALAKFIYASLFDWLVEQINKSLEVGRRFTVKSISILDIYGFESFEKNSFEQFCINYANERLQQHFNRHLFKLEQEEYELDGIDWTKVDFEDNQECLDLVEKKPLGLLSLLDEESNFPKATDLTFANKLKEHLNANPCFKSPRVDAFNIHHYAGEVLYETSGFLEKNRDPLHHDCIKLLSSCCCKLARLFPGQLHPPGSQKQSVGTKFKGQLFKLMQQLENTTPHFVRCIKPNSKQTPGMYEPDLVLQQLKCCGILEVVRISRSGYPTRITHQEFSRRYGFLLADHNVSQDPLSISIAVLKQFNILPDLYQVGFTKLFFRTGQIGSLEHKSKQVEQGIIGVQKSFRARRARGAFSGLKEGAIALQSIVRGQNFRKEYENLVRCQRNNALAREQVEEEAAQEILHKQQRAILLVQSATRGWLARRRLDYLRKETLLKFEDSDSKLRPDNRYSEVKVMLPTVEELQREDQKTHAMLVEKEEENAELRDQIKQLQKRWSEYEIRTKTMEDTWKKQIASLQVNLAAAKRSLASDSNAGHPGKRDGSLSPQYIDSESTSMGSRTPGSSTPFLLTNNGTDAMVREANGSLSTVSHLVKEFDQQKQLFEDDAKALCENRAAERSFSMNPDEELRKLKQKFEAWKKDYKARLKETKGKLNGEKGRRKWWGKRTRA